MDRDQWAKGAATRLYDAEAGVDHAIASMCRLTGYIAKGRVDHQLLAKLGQTPLTAMIDAQRRMIEARASLLEAHTAMEVAARAVGLHWRMNGPLETPDDGDRPPVPKGFLTRVA